jgi:hypothetical protein
MATIQRPIKTYGNRNYVAEVNAAPANYDPVLANEVDADLDTMYSAWNGGADTVNIKDGAVTYAKLATDARQVATVIGPNPPVTPVNGQLWWRNDPDGVLYIYYNDGTSSQFVPATPTASSLWTVSGTTLTPTDATKNVTVPGTTSASQVVLGPSTIKGRLRYVAGDQIELNINRTDADGQDDAAKTSWTLGAGPRFDEFTISRRPAAGAWATLLKLDNAGKLTLPVSNNALQWGPRTIKGRLIGYDQVDIVGWTINGGLTTGSTAWVQDDVSKATWQAFLRTDSDRFQVSRMAPGGTPTTDLLTLDNAGSLTTGSTLRVTGTNKGMSFQNVGQDLGGGFSNVIAFGWTVGGAIAARVDGTQLGTVNVTPPSDERLKLNVQEDVPGLAAVCALRAISFEYDQSKREIGFEKGRRYGLIAQEAREHVPAVIEDDGSEEHFLGLDYRKLVPVLIQAIKELASRVATLEVP